MCLGGGGDDENEGAFAKNREIEKLIRADEKKMAKEVKLLLLGAGESGKSTILKQMRLLYASGFSRSEREHFRCIIFANILNSFKILLEAMDSFGMVFENDQNENFVELVILDRELERGERMPIEYLKAFKSLWADDGLAKAAQRGNEFALHDNFQYYMENLDRLFTKDYVPSDQDILRSRQKTTGITETVFEMGMFTYRMFDVGGQRSERKKWIHCFENVNCLLFIVAISGYDQCLVEDKEGNQMQEALMLFESISNSQWFTKTALILFLNKMDLFKTKLKWSPISKFFPDYSADPSDTKLACRFFQQKFKGLSRDPNRDIYTHFTNATDTNLLKITMSSVQDMIIQKNLHRLIL